MFLHDYIFIQRTDYVANNDEVSSERLYTSAKVLNIDDQRIGSSNLENVSNDDVVPNKKRKLTTTLNKM